jgi:hypothetical protein
MVDGVELDAADRLSRWGNSKLMTPFGLSTWGNPATKPAMSGTWAKTLLAGMRSAAMPRAASAGAVVPLKNITSVGMPCWRAISAALAAGSMPSTGMPRSRKKRSR